MNISIIILISVISLYILAKAVEQWKYLIPLNLLSGLFSRSGTEGNSGTEVPQEQLIKPRYDIEAYRERMKKLKESVDDDGLFDVPPVKMETDFTGTEIITESAEIDIDKYVGR